MKAEKILKVLNNSIHFHEGDENYYAELPAE